MTHAAPLAPRQLIAVMNTTLLSMMGPGLALRGPDGSMHPAVEGMVFEYNTAYICFVLGLIAFHFSAALFAWLMFTWCAAAPLAPDARDIPATNAFNGRRRLLTRGLSTRSAFGSAHCALYLSPSLRSRLRNVAIFVSGCIVASLYMLMRYASRVFNRFR